MSLELERDCPECGGPRTFYLTASTNLHLGEKRKWACPDCDYAFVRIGEQIGSDQPA
jgi:rubredoxin